MKRNLTAINVPKDTPRFLTSKTTSIAIYRRNRMNVTSAAGDSRRRVPSKRIWTPIGPIATRSGVTHVARSSQLRPLSTLTVGPSTKPRKRPQKTPRRTIVRGVVGASNSCDGSGRT
uniref:(northern house mosquito) hypothetical protein n=1 Tax=Culex pipiens TaxID=7175 RepID=A0A8D8F6S9_CULPI